MRRARYFAAVAVLVWSGECFGQLLDSLLYPHNYSRTQTVPHGCLFYMPSFDAPPDEVFFDSTFALEDATGVPSSVRVRVWRIGCHEPDRSAIVVKLQSTNSSSSIIKPRSFLRVPGSGDLQPAGLFLFSSFTEPARLDAIGAELFPIANQVGFEEGATFVVSGLGTTTPDQYNDTIELILDFGPSPSTGGRSFIIPLFSYDPFLDPPQSPRQPLTGRHSGQWEAEGLPRSGLVLQVAEVPGTDRNFVFAIWFTYSNGIPIWVVGNTDISVGSDEVEIEMLSLSGGDFITRPGSFTGDDVISNPVGTMTLRVSHCNEIEADLDFTPVDEGTASLTLTRLIRIAGYDCDQTQ